MSFQLVWSLDALCLCSIVFDWDDTLLASTWLASRDMRLDGPAVLPSEIKEELVRLEHQVFRLLELARSVGDTVIITNAETGYVIV